MIDIATLSDATDIRKAIRLFQWMAQDRFSRVGQHPATLLDNGSSDPLLLDGDPRDPYPRSDVEILCDLGFLRRDAAQLKPTDKANRLVEALYAKQDRLGWIWIVVGHGEIFIDEGATAPDLRALMGGEWNPGDRVVVTCHDPEYALVRHLPLALAACDPMFIADLEEVNEDFKYADAEVDVQ